MTHFCRSEDIARCVEAPIPFEDDDPWCPYHQCVAYVQAPACGPIEDRATHKCTVDIVNTAKFECVGNPKYSHMDVLLPAGCMKGEGSCKVVRTCQCELIAAGNDRERYTMYDVSMESCGMKP